MAKKWHYIKDGQSYGPVFKKDIISMLESGELSRETLVWPKGSEKWILASDAFDLDGRVPPPVPEENAKIDLKPEQVLVGWSEHLCTLGGVILHDYLIRS